MAMEIVALNERRAISHEKSTVTIVDGSKTKEPAASLSMEAQDTKGEQQVPCNNSLTSPDHCKQISEASQMLIVELEKAEALFQKGCDALNGYQLEEALDCLSRALEIRVKHHGELAPECLSTYYQYGRALYCKGLEDSEPFDKGNSAPKIEETSNVAPYTTVDVHSEAAKTCEVPVTNTVESSHGLTTNSASAVPAHCDTSVTSDIRDKPQASQTLSNSDAQGDTSGQNEGGECENQDNVPDDEGIDLESEDEESDLDLAWKMFDIVRVILEKNQQADDILRMVEIYTLLGDVSLQQENFEASFQDYCKALSYLEGAVRPDCHYIAQLCYKICVALEWAEKVTEALRYGKKAVSVCETRLHRLKNKILTLTKEGEAHSNKVTLYSKEMRVIAQLLIDYREKVDGLQHLVSFPQFIKRTPSSKGKNMTEQEINLYSEGLTKDRFDSPTMKDDTSNFSRRSVIDLGIVGRGIMRVTIPVEEEKHQEQNG